MASTRRSFVCVIGPSFAEGTTASIHSPMRTSPCWRISRVERTKLVESAFAGALKLRGFRKRGRNWFRTTSAGEYQVVNLQKSSWGSGDFDLNLGWDSSVPSGQFRSENFCLLS